MNLGRTVNGLVPCLDPDLEEKAYKNEKTMSIRTYDT